MPLSGMLYFVEGRNFHPFLWTLLLVLLHLFSFIYLYTKTNMINQSKESDEAKQALRLLICFSLEAIRPVEHIKFRVVDYFCCCVIWTIHSF